MKKETDYFCEQCGIRMSGAMKYYHRLDNIHNDPFRRYCDGRVRDYVIYES